LTGLTEGNEIPEDVDVHRILGFDAARQLSIFGRYPRALALPDRWGSWRFLGVRAALKLIRRYKIDAIWSTFPIATAHCIGLAASSRSGVPWVAEFRDPMWQGEYPPDPVVNRAWQQLEKQVFACAQRVVVTTRGAARLYAERFPHFDPSSLAVIENGYDEATFQRLENQSHEGTAKKTAAGEPLTLLHSGVIYRSERDPTKLFAALAALKNKGVIGSAGLRIVLRATGDDMAYRRDVAAAGIDDIVRVEPPVDYVSALHEMLSVDGLLVLQASNCNAQVPAKLYEYLRAGRPILALTDPIGDTARTLDDVQAGLIASLDSRDAIEAALARFLTQIKNGTWRRPTGEAVAWYSRESQAGQFARLLDAVI
jgi:hypothetical protein